MGGGWSHWIKGRQERIVHLRASNSEFSPVSELRKFKLDAEKQSCGGESGKLFFIFRSDSLKS